VLDICHNDRANQRCNIEPFQLEAYSPVRKMKDVRVLLFGLGMEQLNEFLHGGLESGGLDDIVLLVPPISFSIFGHNTTARRAQAGTRRGISG
jgi:hypothetical protein